MITTTFRDKEIKVKEKLTLTESISFIKSVVDNVVDTNEGTFEPLFFNVSLMSNILTMYTDTQDIDIDEVYDNYDEYETFFADILKYQSDFNSDQYQHLFACIHDEIEFKKQQIIHNQNSAMDEMFVAVNTFLTTLNEKAKEFDVKKLDKVIKKLNPQEILKAYQRSGIGDSARDKAIQDLAKENKELKNQIGARNVLADK